MQICRNKKATTNARPAEGEATPHSSLRLIHPPPLPPAHSRFCCCCCWPFTVLRRNFFLNSHAHLPPPPPVQEQQMAPKISWQPNWPDRLRLASSNAIRSRDCKWIHWLKLTDIAVHPHPHLPLPPALPTPLLSFAFFMLSFFFFFIFPSRLPVHNLSAECTAEWENLNLKWHSGTFSQPPKILQFFVLQLKRWLQVQKCANSAVVH